jgi:hypothetical protein
MRNDLLGTPSLRLDASTEHRQLFCDEDTPAVCYFCTPAMSVAKNLLTDAANTDATNYVANNISKSNLLR